MSGQGWPGQNPGMQQIQDMQDRQRQMADYQQWAAGRGPVQDRLGCLGRLVRGLVTLVLGLAWVAALVLAVVVAVNEQFVAAAIIGVGVLILIGLTNAVHGWGRS